MTDTPQRAFTAPDPRYDARVRQSFAAQKVMELIGARIEKLEPGRCSIGLAWREDLCQHNGFFHAGIIATVADSAGGYAGYTLMPPDSNVLTAEYKISLIRPGAGSWLRAEGEVIRPGRTLVFSQVRILTGDESGSTHCATMTQTLACVTAN